MRRHYKLLSALCLPAMIAIMAPGCSDDEQICAQPLASCSGQCVETRFDPNNCGACGVQCGDGLVCSAGVCQEACDSGLTDCEGRCVDTQLDPLNCGACDSACGAGELCSAGVCGTTCVGGSAQCGDVCVDVDTDEANCGSCGTACGTGETCITGTCVPGCDSNLTLCNNACVDTNIDVANCGTCGTACGGTQVCALGSCEDVNPLGAFLTSAYRDAVSQDLYVVNDYTFDAIKVNPVTFDDDTVIDYAVVPDGSIVLVAAQDTKGVFELYHSPTPGGALTKLSAALVTDGDVQPGIVVSSDGTKVLYRADQEADEVFDLWTVDLSNPGVATKVNPALDTDEDVIQMALSADGTTAVYISDEETEGLNEAFVVTLSNPGASTKVSATQNFSGVDRVAVNSDGSTVVYRAREDASSWMELYEVVVSSPGASTKLNPGRIDGGEAAPVGNVDAFALTSDDASVVMAVRRGNLNRELYMATLGGTPNPTELSLGGGTSGSVQSDFVISGDDTTAYYRESLQDEERLYAADLTSPGTVNLASDLSAEAHDVEEFVLSADDSALVYRREVDGPEGMALYQVDTANLGTATQVTPFFPLAYQPEFVVTSDGERVLYREYEDTFSSQTPLFVAGIANPEVRIAVGPTLMHNQFRSQLHVEPSSERTYLVADGEASQKFELYRVDTGSASAWEKVSADFGAASDVTSYVVSGDGSTIIYLADADSPGVRELYLVSAATPGVATKVTPASSGGQITDFAVSHDGSTVVYRSTEAGAQDLYAVDAASLGTAVKLNGATAGDVQEYDVSPDGATVVFKFAPDSGSDEIFSVAVASPGTVTTLNHAGVDVSTFTMSHDWTMVGYIAGSPNELYFVTLTTPASETKVNDVLLGGRNVADFKWSADDSFFIYRADDATDNLEELFHVTRAAPTVFTKVNGSVAGGSGVSNYVISPDDGNVAFRSNHESNRWALYVTDLSAMGSHARAHALQTSTILQVHTDDPIFTSDSANVIYRGDLVTNGRDDLYTTALSGLGTATELSVPRANSSADVFSNEWGLSATNQAVFLHSAFTHSIRDIYTTPAATPATPTGLTPFVTPGSTFLLTPMK